MGVWAEAGPAGWGTRSPPALPLLGASGTCGVQHDQKHEADTIIIWTDQMTGPESSSKKPKAHSPSGHLSPCAYGVMDRCLLCAQMGFDKCKQVWPG